MISSVTGVAATGTVSYPKVLTVAPHFKVRSNGVSIPEHFSETR